MGRETKTNRFSTAGKDLVGSSSAGNNEEKQETLLLKPETKKKLKL